MSTRGALGFIVNGQEKIGYNHSDSYPAYLGDVVLNFLKETNLEEAAVLAGDVELVDEDIDPTSEQFDRLQTLKSVDASAKDWHWILRDTQGDPQAMLESGFIVDHNTFPLDSLFCEYAYIVNFDAQVLEVYKGFQSSPHDLGRFASRAPNDPKYYPVALRGTFPFVALPDLEELTNILEREDSNVA